MRGIDSSQSTSLSSKSSGGKSNLLLRTALRWLNYVAVNGYCKWRSTKPFELMIYSSFSVGNGLNECCLSNECCLFRNVDFVLLSICFVELVRSKVLTTVQLNLWTVWLVLSWIFEKLSRTQSFACGFLLISMLASSIESLKISKNCCP